MKFCPNCGTGHECEGEETGREKAEVAIARLHTNRDIEVARITAAAGVQVAETEAEHETAHAAGVVEGVEAVMDAVTGAGEPEGEVVPEGDPIVVETAPEPEAEPVLDAPPPPEVVHEPAARSNNGWWSGYR